MDVIVNRAPLPAASADGGERAGTSSGADCNVVCPFLLSDPGDANDNMDHFYRAVILFLPQCGVFYCHWDRHVGDAGVRGTFRAYDMSWLHLHRTVSLQGQVESYTFAKDSFVKKFYQDFGPSQDRGGSRIPTN